MPIVIEAALWLAAALLAVPLIVLAVECMAASCGGRDSSHGNQLPRPRCGVIIPAHDEETILSRTLAELRPQIRSDDRLIVVADNCTDRTADVARQHGAEVVERSDQIQRGKGYALAAGVAALDSDPPVIVVIIDADSRVPLGTIDGLVGAAATTGRPVQAAYLLDPPLGAGPRSRLSALAFRFKNLIRPLGLHRLGVPCMLTGAGMAFPYPVLRRAPLASGNIVEDMRLGVDLAVAGNPPLFEPTARIGGELATEASAAKTQRTRWEHGHLRTIAQAPRLFAAAVRLRQPRLAGLALELMVPPLSVLGLLWLLALTVCGAWWLSGGTAGPFIVLTAAAVLNALSMTLAWVRFGRDVAPLTVLLAAPWYVVSKIPIYLAFLFRPQRAWIRTPRTPEPPLQEVP
jgi:cellulose synthase/poly-beta-1,6-N-acetylglucosamine synthase-like glycosyltransferase